MQALQGHDLAVLSINYFEDWELGKGSWPFQKDYLLLSCQPGDSTALTQKQRPHWTCQRGSVFEN